MAVWALPQGYRPTVVHEDMFHVKPISYKNLGLILGQSLRNRAPLISTSSE